MMSSNSTSPKKKRKTSAEQYAKDLSNYYQLPEEDYPVDTEVHADGCKKVEFSVGGVPRPLYRTDRLKKLP